MWALGIDIGGTTASIVLLQAGQPVNPKPPNIERSSRVQEGPQATANVIASLVRDVLKRGEISLDDVSALGITFPAPTTHEGVVQVGVNMGPAWTNVNIKALLESALSRELGGAVPSIHIINDCNAAALCEAALRHDEGVRSLALVAPGTGLGGGVVINGQVWAGASGSAAEFGHLSICPEVFAPGMTVPRRCNCGGIGCAESYASLTALSGIFREIVVPEDSALLRFPSWERRVMNVRTLAEEGDRFCRSLYLWQARCLGNLLQVIAIAYNPQLFVIGGGFIEVNDTLRSEIFEAVHEGYRFLPSSVAPKVLNLEFARADDNAAAIGAALYALSMS